ncbi:Gene Transfer Agent NlpC/P60 family peptidase [Paracoccus yeei]|uniref:Gene Transfer Agent NlpC/P60 family peptidase n=1 Tax=Paracoccus yeei TaxID=147645 RepID=A0A386UM17_9RHOB|nr:NlpC/P60 family protein [Paracoccus yeei]AYF01727.1 Gene Transfer Agent NlpC/P60 family peptidase [Paracoccus yeei]
MSQRIVAAARGWIGTPYVHQASVKGAGTDCLGLVRGIWRELYGPEPEALPAYTPDWGEAGAQELLLGGAGRLLLPAGPEAAGDVLIFRMRSGAIAKHMGILAETGAGASFVHAYDRHGVVESPLSTPWRAKITGRFRFPPLT